MSERYTAEELLGKVEWEGGYDALFEYGISGDEVPKELEPLWTIAQRYWEAFQKLTDQIDAWLEENDGDRAEGE